MVTKLMTNIDSYFYNFIDKESKENKISKREVLEKVISEYIENRKKEKLEKSYMNMWNDEEYLTEMKNNSKYLGNL